jgi:hypothetical protein
MYLIPPFPAGWRAARLALPLALAALPRVGLAGELTAIYAQASPGFVRARLPDGTLAPVTYTLGEGGTLPGAPYDASIDRLNFFDLAKAVSGPLEDQNYRPVPDRDPNKTKILVMVYWGTTRGAAEATSTAAYQNLQAAGQAAATVPPPPPPPSASARGSPPPVDGNVAARAAYQGDITSAMAAVGLEDRQRADADLKIASLLGYDSELDSLAGGIGPRELKRADLIHELEEDRYFVVLMAYDFDALWKHQKHRLLWVTRLSVRARGTNFTVALPAMVRQAGKYFGADTHGLVRDPLPLGRVEVGPVKSLGVVPGR